MKTHWMMQSLAAGWVSAALSIACALHSAPVAAAGNISVVGGGQYLGPFGQIAVTVNAVQDSHGNVSGQFEQIALPAGGSAQGGVPNVHGSVTCLDVSGNTAFIGGVLTSVKNLDPQFGIVAGLPFYLAVEDNGHARQAKADEVSPFTVTDPGTFGLCSDSGLDAYLLTILVPLSNGNFTIGR